MKMAGIFPGLGLFIIRKRKKKTCSLFLLYPLYGIVFTDAPLAPSLNLHLCLFRKLINKLSEEFFFFF